MKTLCMRRALALAWMGWSASAWAQDGGYSIDIEVLRPSFGHQAFVGVDVPRVQDRLAFRAGTVFQYQQAPLTLYQAVDDTELGAVVANRFSGMVGASLDVERVTFGVMVPTALNWGSEQPDYAADGFGLGDIGATARWTVVRTPHDRFNVGLRGGIMLPTGRSDSYIGEGRVRLAAGGLVAARIGPVTVASDLGVMTRTEVETPADFTVGTEVSWGNAVRVALPQATRLALTAQLLARTRAEGLLQGGADTSLEGLVGLDVFPTRTTTVGLAAGRGFTQGYGTTDLRLLGTLSVAWEAPERHSYLPSGISPPPPPPPHDLLLPDRPPETSDEGDHIALDRPLAFYVDTARLRPESVPTLDDVARIIIESPEIGMVIIEGHASQEGDYDHNYALADARARRVWELLLERGVAFDRIAYRHQGEAAPLLGTPGSADLSEEVLQVNRRVEFLIVHRYAPGEAPRYPSRQRLPWNGEEVDVITPEGPAPEDELGDLDADE